jgi:hypothetical protein
LRPFAFRNRDCLIQHPGGGARYRERAARAAIDTRLSAAQLWDRKSDFRVMAFRACAAYLSTIGPFVAKRLEKCEFSPPPFKEEV